MIDDDFDKLVKDMFERFFGNAFRMVPGENGTHIGISPEEFQQPVDNAGHELFIDEIDLGDEYLVLVESPVSIEEPVAYARGTLLEIKVDPVVGQGIEINVPFNIDVEQSTVSHNNGVIEVRLVKSSNSNTELNEGLLKVV
ncbi:MAG: hypothetical protein P1Q69_07955 [Candidatus Thorarchaeota archaeon]|nr:hypothetical protein [Candidatus Thorarchaeota archaeon]